MLASAIRQALFERLFDHAFLFDVQKLVRDLPLTADDDQRDIPSF